MRRKLFCIFLLAVFSIICIMCINFIAENSDGVNFEGDVLMHITRNGENDLVLFRCGNNSFFDIPLTGRRAIFANNNSIFVDQYDSIIEYDFASMQMKTVYNGEKINYFAIYNDTQISIATENSILLYDYITQEKREIINGNVSPVHSWSADGKNLYYSDNKNTIRSLNLLTGETEELYAGYAPIVFDSKIAYQNEGKLIVRNMCTDHVFEFDAYVYNYCFAPSGKEILLEIEMSAWAGVKNGMITGHQLLVWNFETGQTETLVEAFVPAVNSVCDCK